MYVEGHVFDARSPTPVQGVQISALAPFDSVCTPEGECAPVARSVTDQNGFYQLRIRGADSLRSESISVHALCIITDANGEFIGSGAGSAEAHPLEAERILRRDIYMRLPRLFHRLTGCDPEGQLSDPVPVIRRPLDPVLR